VLAGTPPERDEDNDADDAGVAEDDTEDVDAGPAVHEHGPAKLSAADGDGDATADEAPASFSYATVVAHLAFVRGVGAAGGAKTNRNHESVARRWAAFHGKTLENAVGDDFADEDFGRRRDAFLTATNKSKGGLANERSWVNQLREAARQLATQVLARASSPGAPQAVRPGAFSLVLAPLVEDWCVAHGAKRGAGPTANHSPYAGVKHGATVSALARRVADRTGRKWAACKQILKGWLGGHLKNPSGREPSPWTTVVLDALEAELRTVAPAVRVGSFRGFVVDKLKTHTTRAYPGRAGVAPVAPTRGGVAPKYRLDFARWPAPLRELWTEYERFKMSPDPGGNLQRSGEWTPDASGHVASQGITRRAMELFFGFLTLPTDPERAAPHAPGLGMDPADLTFEVLVGAERYRAYFDWHAARNGGVTRSIDGPCNIQNNLTESETGWLWQVADRFVERSLRGARRDRAVAELRDWMEREGAELRRHTEKMLGRVHSKRTVHSPKLRTILRHRQPMSTVFDLLRRFEMDAPGATYRDTSLRVLSFQAVLFTVVAFTAFPLRRRTWTLLKVGEHFYRDDEGWVVAAPPALFKNRAHLDEPWTVRAAQWANPYIDHYMRHVRPHLWGARQGSPYVLVLAKYMRKGGEPVDPAGPMDPRTVAGRLRVVTRNYLGMSLGTHWLRHAAATQYLKDHPEDYVGTATLLNDSLPTVLETYAHVEADDYFDRYNDSSNAAYNASRVRAGTEQRRTKPR
jgi:hypothetical protein